jgi:hypothetical protein
MNCVCVYISMTLVFRIQKKDIWIRLWELRQLATRMFAYHSPCCAIWLANFCYTASDLCLWASAQCVRDGWLPYYDFSKKLESSSKLCSSSFYNCGSQWLHGLKRRPWSLGPWDRWFVSRLRHGCLSSSFCGVLSCVGRGFCDGLITRPEEPYRVSKQINETSRVWFVQGPIKDRKATERWWLLLAKLHQMWCV